MNSSPILENNFPFLYTVVSIHCILCVLKISSFRIYRRYMVNLKAQSLGESLNSKMVGLKLLHLNGRLVKLRTSIYYIFLSFKQREKFQEMRQKMRLGVEQKLEIQNHQMYKEIWGKKIFSTFLNIMSQPNLI